MLLLIAVIFASVNIIILRPDDINGRPYRVEISRMAELIENNSLSSDELSECRYVTDIVKYSDSPDDFYSADSDYAVRVINGELYRFDYTSPADDTGKAAVIINIALGIMSAVTIGIMLYIRTKILRPFKKMSDIPYELSKGNLTPPVKETKSRFFGKFIWGIDLLRENMEEQRKRELELQKEKKILLLSLPHDVKTPLSAIKLYAKALSNYQSI